VGFHPVPQGILSCFFKCAGHKFGRQHAPVFFKFRLNGLNLPLALKFREFINFSVNDGAGDFVFSKSEQHFPIPILKGKPAID
jgi:hypothetical protein